MAVVFARCLNGASFLQASPELFCAKDRTRDVDAISQVIQTAKTFVFISVTDYLPLVSRRFRGTTVTRCHRSKTCIFLESFICVKLINTFTFTVCRLCVRRCHINDDI